MLGIDASQNHIDTWTLQGHMHLLRREWNPARKKFEHITKLNASNLV